VSHVEIFAFDQIALRICVLMRALRDMNLCFVLMPLLFLLQQRIEKLSTKLSPFYC